MAATILVIDDEEHLRWILSKALNKTGYRVLTAATGQEGLKLVSEQMPDLVLLDLRLPDLDGITILKTIKKDQPQLPVIVITAHGTVETAIEAMKAGAVDYLTKPFDLDELKLVIERTLTLVELSQEVDYLRGELRERQGEGLIGQSPSMVEIRELIGRIADTAATVLIQGESGTGKEVVARQLHLQSSRANKPFVAINCAAIPENLLESELFGHERGAFTGANARKKGKLELVRGGTLFLDEIGEMPLTLQAKLLRVLQERTYERVGGTEPLKLEARIIAATNRDLRKAIQEGKFREDLYYRLQVIPIHLPPLRERREDIPLLVQHFLRKYDPGKRLKGVAPEAMALLQQYHWPGNIRELENTIERAVILCTGHEITPENLPREISGDKQRVAGVLLDFPPEGINLEEVERELIRLALVRSGGNQTQAARLLGITRSALIYRMEKYGL
ncbi:sigma-54 dependent transcriptional regulator [Carboxydocella sp. ULO1]|uniref:sigma-54-dependent transcriptional regulator n=1 Tax=Carboxydocella sp. ULO1 TaxID=1926599 RepID=UPI0009ADC821|nr:sigma-54 dependent transcriptional regulator [Carboxydocella sp. ULO1]GAW28331.1 sigma-54-dependent Fis family transcriptional regulator [Carboxydocella sp. ULO1]